MRKLIFSLTVVTVFALMLVVPSVAGDRAAGAADITGSYACEGVNPEGGTYRGTVEITKQGEAYQVQWTIGKGDNYKGIGILEGDLLSVSYYGGITGIVVYKVEGSKLSGKWAVLDGSGKIYSETLTKQ